MVVWPSRFKTLTTAQAYVRKSEALTNKVYGGGGQHGHRRWLAHRGRGLSS